MLAPVLRPPANRPTPLPRAAQPSQSSAAAASEPGVMPNAEPGEAGEAREDRIDDANVAADRRLERLAEAIARRTQLRLLQEKAGDDARQIELDRLKQEFDFEQKERAELLREFNLMRELALDQMKKDDEAVKKWMALV
jgi:predicted secreted protein